MPHSLQRWLYTATDWQLVHVHNVLAEDDMS